MSDNDCSLGHWNVVNMFFKFPIILLNMKMLILLA